MPGAQTIQDLQISLCGVEDSATRRQTRAKKPIQITALQPIRKLKGGSQPVLIHASDGFFYVIKFVDNLQGPNVAFNEAMGTELYRACGLPGPEWAPIWVSDEFLDSNPEFWMLTPEGMRRPSAGWCFGSRFLGLHEAPLREILSSSHFGRIVNRADFWKARIVDALCQHADNRQALFVEDDEKWLEAYFLDHGHMFGGPKGAANPVMATSGYLDKRIYPTFTVGMRNAIETAIKRINRAELMKIVHRLPEEWVTPSALAGLESSLQRLADRNLLRNLGNSLMDGNEDAKRTPGRKAPQRVHYANAALCSQVPPTGFLDGTGRWASRAACGER